MRTIKDLKDKRTKEAFFPRTHMDAVIDNEGKSVSEKIAGKQDTITDLSAIRSGAALGATALQSETDPIFSASPAAGITEQDITKWNNSGGGSANAVLYTTQTLTNAQKTQARNNIGAGTGSGTYSKPSGGIPKTDLASAVQTSLGLADNAIPNVRAISDGTNFNTLITSQIIYIGGFNVHTNYPSGWSGQGMLIVSGNGQSGSNARTMQLAITYDGKCATRFGANGSWTAWRWNGNTL